MKMYKLENKYEIWYFTTKAKLARFLDCTPQNIENALRRRSKYLKEWTIEIVDEDYVMSKFIDPESPYDAKETYLMGQIYELVKQIVENDNRIKELEDRIQGLTKNLNDNYKNIN